VANILCIDREPGVGQTLERVLAGMGHHPVVVGTLDTGLSIAAREPFDLIISDEKLPDGSVSDLLRALREQGQDVPVITTSPYQSARPGVPVVGLGTVNHLTKPLRTEALRIAVANAIELDRLRRAQEGFQREIEDLRGAHRIVGTSAALRAALDLVQRVAPTGATVLLQGESGTGKELFARAIREQSPRARQPLITVNCAALPEGLVESTLFGHERGAFTGAVARSLGAFERAHRGTLMLDEVSEMRLDLQGKLLRAIQEREFERVGGTDAVHVDVRIIATTNRDLLAEVEAGRFRRDLYFRLHVFPIHMPALRDRAEDIPQLTEYFLQQIASQLGVRSPVVAPDALGVLCRRYWSGNVRELANVLEHALILSRGQEITAEVLDHSHASGTGGAPAPGTGPRASAGPGEGPLAPATSLNLHELQSVAIERALQASGGNRTRAAILLGISERTLRNKLKAKRSSVTRREDGPAQHPWPARPGSRPGASEFPADPTSGPKASSN
jgi:DNA-binding NtrC family response regulator